MSLFLSLENDIKELRKKTNNREDLDGNSKEVIDLYNNAIDMMKKKNFTSSKNLLESKNLVDSQDFEIINSTALVNLLFGEFDKSCELFYKSNRINSNYTSEKYIKVMVSKEFKVFLEYYNLGIMKINDGNYDEAIDIFLNICNKEDNLIEPYLLLYSLYNKIKDNEKKEKYIDIIRNLDNGNEILFLNMNEVNNKKEEIKNNKSKKRKKNNKKKKKKRKFSKFIIFLAIIIGISYFYSESNKIKQSTFSSNEKKINNNKIIENKNNIKKNENDNIDKDLKNSYLEISSEEELAQEAKKLKKNKNYEELINVYKAIIELNKSTNMVSEATYQIALLNESLKNYDESIEYYEKYIDNYSTSYPYYDESYYNLAMIYYDTDIEKCKEYLTKLIVKDPKSIYNNSKTKEILED